MINKKIEYPFIDFEQKLLSFASMRNENILRILGVSRASSLITPSLISNSTDHFIDLGLELADGNLNDLLKSGISYSKIGIFRQIVAGLQFLSDQEIVHGRIHPKNILFCQNSGKIETKLADYYHFPDFSDKADSWTSPEHQKNQNISAASDIFHLGCVLYFLLSEGEFPFPKMDKKFLFDVPLFAKDAGFHKVYLENMLHKKPFYRVSITCVSKFSFLLSVEEYSQFLRALLKNYKLGKIRKNLISRLEWNLGPFSACTHQNIAIRSYYNRIVGLLRAQAKSNKVCPVMQAEIFKTVCLDFQVNFGKIWQFNELINA